MTGPGQGRAERPVLQQLAGDATRRRRSADIRHWASAILYCEGDADAAVHRERNQHAAPVRHAQSQRRTSKTASTTVSSTVRCDAVNPEQTRNQGRRSLSRSTFRPGESTDDPAAAQRRRRRPARAKPARGARPLRSATSTTCFEARRREADEFYATVIPATLDADAAQCDAAGAGRDAVVASSSTTTTSIRWLKERGVGSRSRRRSKRRRATSTGITWSTPTSSRCRTNGSIPGTPRGISRFTCIALTLVDHGFRQAAAQSDAGDQLPASERQMPAYEWNFGDVNPPVHAWSTIFTYRLEKRETRRGGRRLAGTQLSTSCCSISPGG